MFYYFKSNTWNYSFTFWGVWNCWGLNFKKCLRVVSIFSSNSGKATKLWVIVLSRDRNDKEWGRKRGIWQVEGTTSVWCRKITKLTENVKALLGNIILWTFECLINHIACGYQQSLFSLRNTNRCKKASMKTFIRHKVTNTWWKKWVEWKCQLSLSGKSCSGLIWSITQTMTFCGVVQFHVYPFWHLQSTLWHLDF